MSGPKDPALISGMARDPEVQRLKKELFLKTLEYRYSYNFSWLGRPVIQYPEDLVALQEIVWTTQPDIIVETGVAHGGSLVFYASLLHVLGGDRVVVGVDIDIRAPNRQAIVDHPLSSRIELLEGSSIADDIVQKVHDRARGKERCLVVLDSMHSHAHVLAELRAYSPLVRRGGYLVVLDTVVEYLPKSLYPDRPWGPGDNPLTAVNQFLAESDRFEIDREIEDKLMFTVGPSGYLRCIKD
jgi:cephalosporin hydroxylase